MKRTALFRRFKTVLQLWDNLLQRLVRRLVAGISRDQKDQVGLGRDPDRGHPEPVTAILCENGGCAVRFQLVVSAQRAVTG